MVDTVSQFMSDDSRELLVIEVENFLMPPQRYCAPVKQSRSNAWTQVSINCF